MLKIAKKTFFGTGMSIRYITPHQFKEEKYLSGGDLLYYKGDPRYIINISIWGNDGQDFIVSYGELTSAPDEEMERLITEHEVELIKMSEEEGFFEVAIDLKSMKIIRNTDLFTERLPTHGINSLFIFSELDDAYMYMLVNPMKWIKDTSVYNWLLAYIYSSYICLTPVNETNKESIAFIQSLSYLSAHGGNYDNFVLEIDKESEFFPMRDIEKITIEVPGNTNRSLMLLAKAKEQFGKVLAKRNKRHGK